MIMIQSKYGFRIFLFTLFSVFAYQCAHSQKYERLEGISKEIDTAFQTSNWKKVIEFGRLYDKTFNEEKKKKKKKDSLALIESLNIRYKIIIAYNWLNKADSGNINIRKFTAKHAVFPLHQEYNRFYKVSAQAISAFINNQTQESEKLFLEAFRIANSKLKSNNEVYVLATENLAIQLISEYKLNQAANLLYNTLLYFNRNKISQIYQARVYYLLYLANYFDANYQMAFENANKCFLLLQGAENSMEGFLEAKAKLAAGICLFHLKEFNQSKETLHQSWQLFNKFDFLINQEFALNLNYLAKVYYHLNNNTLALEYKLKVQGIFEKMYRSKSHYRLLQIALSSFYTIKELSIDGIDMEGYDLLTDFEYVFQRMPEDYIHANKVRLYIYSMQAFSYARNKKFLTSISCLKNGLLLRKSKLPERHTLLRPWYKMIASCYSVAGKQDSAIFFYEKVIESYKYRNGHQQANKANNNYNKSPELINLFYSIGHCYFQKAKQENNSKKYFEKALVYFKNCDMLSGQISKLLNNRDDRLILASNMSKVYDLGITCCFDLAALTENNQEKENLKRLAFIFSQQNKATLLEEMVTKFEVRKMMGLPDKIIKQEHEIKNKINHWEKIISQRTIIETKNFEHPIIYYRRTIDDKLFNNTEATDSLHKYIDLHNKFQRKLKQKFPNYFDLLYARNVYSVEEIQNHLDTSSVLIDYHSNNGHLETFIISKRDFFAVRIKTPDDFKGLIEEYRYSLLGFYKKKQFVNKALHKFIKKGSSLYKFLIKPIEKNIKAKRKLIIIVSEELSLLPFETLVADNKVDIDVDLANLGYLIKKHSIAYNYSSNLWIESIRKSSSNKSRQENFLGIAPIFDPDKMIVAGMVSKGEDDFRMQPKKRIRLSKLSATKRAVEDICVIANNRGIIHSKYYYNEANKFQFQNNADNKKYILVATHGKAHYSNPKLSGLYFAANDSSANFDDDILYSSEAYNLNLSCDLLVLYACETGTGQIKKGEGTISISRGFMASGAANVIHTLWSIQDVSTKDLVVDLFDDVFNKNDYSNSLRKAKLKMIEYGVIPFHWAGLVLIGN